MLYVARYHWGNQGEKAYHQKSNSSYFEESSLLFLRRVSSLIIIINSVCTFFFFVCFAQLVLKFWNHPYLRTGMLHICVQIMTAICPRQPRSTSHTLQIVFSIIGTHQYIRFLP
jgi:hypothetical protein